MLKKEEIKQIQIKDKQIKKQIKQTKYKWYIKKKKKNNIILLLILEEVLKKKKKNKKKNFL